MLKRGVKQLLAEANAEVETLSVEEALPLVGDPDAVFVDIREPAELKQSGKIEGAVHAPRGMLEFQADPESPYHNKALAGDKRLVLYCASGGRSALAAKALQDMGFERVSHVGGGFIAWKQADGPTEES